LLVYGKAADPATLILHGNDGKTWVSIEDNPPQRPNTKLAAEIKQVLEKAPISQAG
jgi:hypothetical protein